MNPMTSYRLKELEIEENELQFKLNGIRKKIREEKLSLVESVFGVKVGSVVLFENKKHRVTSIDPKWNKPWLTGNPIKKNGEFGDIVRNMSDYWETVPDNGEQT